MINIFIFFIFTFCAKLNVQMAKEKRIEVGERCVGLFTCSGGDVRGKKDMLYINPMLLIAYQIREYFCVRKISHAKGQKIFEKCH